MPRRAKDYGHEREMVDQVLEERGEPKLGDGEWGILAGPYVFPAGLNGSDEYADGAQLIIDIRALPQGRSQGGAAHRGTLDVPEHWRLYCERLFGAHASEARLARDILGLPTPVAEGELEDYLRGVADHERAEGDLLQLYFQRPDGELRVLPIYLGYHERELRELISRGELRRGTPPPTPPGMSEEEWRKRPEADLGRNTVFHWIAQRTNRLCRIAEMATGLAKESGCSPAQAVAFLLCDVVPRLAWLAASTRSFDDGRRHTFSIHVGSALVPAEDVRTFYMELREEAASPGVGRPAPRRGRSPWTYQLLAFIDERKRQGWSWREMFEEWHAQYPEHPYRSVPAMQRSFYQAGGQKWQKPGSFEVPDPWKPERGERE
jgi:hypothetical protein